MLEVEASADCKSACDADVSFSVECSLTAHYPDVLSVSVEGSARLASASDAFVASLQGLGTVVDAGARAAACTAQAVSVATQAAARVDVTVMASIEVSGSMTAQGMGSAGP
jgi:hypothetical protein